MLFPNIQFESLTRPFIDTVEKAQVIVTEIESEMATSGRRSLVIDTTQLSIEEIGARMLQRAGIERRADSL